jgi:hypothetical protein
VYAPHAGVLVFLKRWATRRGRRRRGGRHRSTRSPAPPPCARHRDGVLFASTAHRHVLRGMHVCKIAGATAFRSGDLLSQ